METNGFTENELSCYLDENIDRLNKCEVKETLLGGNGNEGISKVKLTDFFNLMAACIRNEIDKKNVSDDDKKEVKKICDNYSYQFNTYYRKLLNNGGANVKPDKEFIDAIKNVYNAKIKYNIYDNDLINKAE